MPRIASQKDYTAFKELLVAKREDAGLTQQAVAERLGCGQSTVAKMENGERRIDVVEFFVVAKAIGFDPMRFLRELRKKIGD